MIEVVSHVTTVCAKALTDDQMPERDQINVRIEKAGDDFVKVVWSDATGSKFPPYRVYRRWIAEKATAARSTLDQLRAVYLQPRSDFDSALRNVAKRGWELRQALFQDHVPEDGIAAADPRDWFEDLQRSATPPVRIVAYADPVLPIPWGLLHEHGPVRDEAIDYGAFWALRHDVIALYGGMAPQPFRKARSAENVLLLSGLNQEVFDKTLRHLADEEQKFILNYIDRPVGKAYSSVGCETRFKNVGSKDCVFHFFGHATASELHFSDDDLLRADGFRRLFYRESRLQRQSQFGYVLSFLNGCASGTGQGAESFLIATAYPGFCGFIGAEAVVPDRFALLFGQELLHGLLDDGQSVRQTITGLWRKHVPMGLFYGCYAHPDFRIARADPYTPLPPVFASANHPIPDGPSQ
jgi:hypothetical protein